ncbi:MAG: hypothetical protein V4719_31325 [Planctomycetota bacterium]
MLTGFLKFGCQLLCCGVICSAPLLSSASAAPKPAPKSEAKAEEHAHPEVGPHKGALIELGDEEYHAEILFDEDKDLVTIYLLDSAAKVAVASDAKEVVVNLKHDGKGVQFKLKAVPMKADPEGKASRYASKSAELMHAMHEKDAKPQLRVAIKGKTYSGKIEPHDDHDHEHKEKK